MSGFAHDANGVELVYSGNVDFSGGTVPTGQITTNGQMLIGTTALNAGGTHINVGTITSPSGTLTVGYSSPNITLDLAGGSIGIDSVAVDAGTSPVVPTAAGLISLLGTANQITTTGSLNTITLSVPATFIAPGSIASTTTITAGTGLTVTTGNAAVSAGNITLPATNAGLTQGVLSITSGPRLHSFGTNNVFLGSSAGNGTLTGTASVGIGTSALAALTSGNNNIAIGVNAATLLQGGGDNLAIGVSALTTATSAGQSTALGRSALRLNVSGTNNTATGYESLRNVLGSSNTAIGYQTGTNYTGSEGNNILIGAAVNGTLGESNVTRIGAAQNTCFIDGIDNVNVGSVSKVVTMASDQLGTATITAGAGISVTPAANTITIASTGSPMTWTDQSGAFAAAAGNGYFITGTSTATLPGSPSQGNTISFIVDTTNALTITANTGQVIRLGNVVSSTAGTAVSTARGDSIKLVYRSTGAVWASETGPQGNWTIT